MEYSRIVGMEVVDMLTSVHKKVRALESRVLTQHMFRGDGLQNFIHNHQDRLEHIKGQLGDLTMMMDHAVCHHDITLESYRQDLRWVERLNRELLRQVAALEHGWGNLIIIPDSPELVLVPPPGGLSLESVLVGIDDGVDDEQVQVIMEDQVEGVVRRRVMIEEGGVFRITGEEYEDGEDLEDVLRRVEAWDWEILRYPLALDYNDPNFIPDVQQ